MQLLANLGTPARRPTRPAPEPNIGPCKRCGNCSVVWASLPSGARVPLDAHPNGPLVLRGGVALELQANEGERRYIMHFTSCKPKGETP